MAYLCHMQTEALILRQATDRDIAGVDALLARSYPRLLRKAYPPSVMVTAVPILARANPALVTSGTYYVAETEAGRIIGAGGWSVRSRAGRTAEMRHLAVDPDVVRQGVGRRIVQNVLAEAKGAGLWRMACLATRNAVPFYQSMGFQAVGPVTIGLGPGIAFEAVQMTLSL